MEVGGWRLGKVIGRGSTATVSLAASVSSGSVFAVKSAELPLSGILQREQRILSAVNSPYVVAYLGFEVSPHEPFRNCLYYNLFMEYATGGSLTDEIKRRGGRLDELDIRRYAFDMLSGLDYLHNSKGVVHCDVKSQNILIGSDRQAKIGDLGCARWAEADGDDEPLCNQLRGTPMFMAPEVARGEEQGTPADIWALGCTVIEMATGRPPWPDVSDPIGAINRIAFSDDVPEFPSWISDEGRDFLSKCLRRDPKQRWTAKQLLEHSFVMASSAPTSSLLFDSWVSPKSTLDLVFWEAQSDEEEEDEMIKLPEEEEEEEDDDPFQRIQELIGCGNVPNWTWEENWSTVRGDSRAPSSSGNPAGEDDKTENSPGNTIITSSSSNETSNFYNGEIISEVSVFSTNLLELDYNFDAENSNNSSDYSVVVQLEELYSHLSCCKRGFSSCNGDCFTRKNTTFFFDPFCALDAFIYIYIYIYSLFVSELVEIEYIQTGLDREWR